MTLPTPRTRRVLTWVLLGVAVIIVCVVIVGLRPRLSRELSKLPDVERQALYARTLETLHTTCEKAPGPEVIEYCQKQAEFIKSFPECDSKCREFAARFSPRPSR